MKFIKQILSQQCTGWQFNQDHVDSVIESQVEWTDGSVGTRWFIARTRNGIMDTTDLQDWCPRIDKMQEKRLT